MLHYFGSDETEVTIRCQYSSNCLNINKDTALDQMMTAVMSEDFNSGRRLNIKFDGNVWIDNGALIDTYNETMQSAVAKA